MKISKERRSSVSKLSKVKGYKKHYNGIKFTRFYFIGGIRFKVANTGIVKATYKGVERIDRLPLHITSVING